MRGAEDAPQSPRSALPRRPLCQPHDATTRACVRHARSIRGGPLMADQVVPTPWARPPSSSVAAEMRLPTLRRWPDQVFDALVLVVLPLSWRSGLRMSRRRRGLRSTCALDIVAAPTSSPSGRRGTGSAGDLIAQPPSLRGRRRGTRGALIGSPSAAAHRRGRRRGRGRRRDFARAALRPQRGSHARLLLPLRTREPWHHGRRRPPPECLPQALARPRPREFEPNAWQKHGKSMAIAWQKHGKGMAIAWQ